MKYKFLYFKSKFPKYNKYYNYISYRRKHYYRPQKYKRYKRFKYYPKKIYKKNDLHYAPRNTTQFIIRHHQNMNLNEVDDSEEEDYIYKGSFLNSIKQINNIDDLSI